MSLTWALWGTAWQRRRAGLERGLELPGSSWATGGTAVGHSWPSGPLVQTLYRVPRRVTGSSLGMVPLAGPGLRDGLWRRGAESPFAPVEPGQKWDIGRHSTGWWHRPAHSKVSHCLRSCSTEAGAGAELGLTSCLVFRSKSSKGSLACAGAEGCRAGSRPWGGLGGSSGGSPGLRANPCLASAALALERARGNVRILEGATAGGPSGCRGLVWAPTGIWPKRLGMERADRLG